ncbi:MAG: hypothetical protein ACTHX0_08040 [Brachybacterium sp.]
MEERPRGRASGDGPAERQDAAAAGWELEDPLDADPLLESDPFEVLVVSELEEDSEAEDSPLWPPADVEAPDVAESVE